MLLWTQGYLYLFKLKFYVEICPGMELGSPALQADSLAKRSNQSILKEIGPEYSLEGLMLKLKLQYFGHLMGRTDSFEKTLMLGKIEAGGEGDNRGWDSWMTSPSQWTWVWVNSGSWRWTGRPGVLQSVGWQRIRHEWATELNWRWYFYFLPMLHSWTKMRRRKENLEIF